MNKIFKGKAIYNPSGKAGEYSYWACNLFNGCSGKCDYCYNRHGIAAKVLGDDIPTLKKCFKGYDHAIEVFEKELNQNIDSLQKHGLFFSFVSDPMLKTNLSLTIPCIDLARSHGVPVKILTKQTEWVMGYIRDEYDKEFAGRAPLAIGFTLTGHDELEPGCSPNDDRISAMEMLFRMGYKTFASIEPIIDFDSSFNVMTKTMKFCNLYKVGLKSGSRDKREDIEKFIRGVWSILKLHPNIRIYYKDSIMNKVSDTYKYFMEGDLQTVKRDYNIFQ